MKELTLKELQLCEIDILNNVHHFCLQNNIRYSLYGGTALGAVRHAGFIPWDDDIDIVMPRPDYEYFRRIYKSTRYQLVDRRDDKDSLIATQNTLLADKDALIAKLQAQLEEYANQQS